MLTLTLRKEPDSRRIIAKITPENRLLCEFLESEIQQDKAYIDYLLDQAATPDCFPFEINGNAHGLTLTEADYRITSLHSEETTSGSLADLMNLLQQWREFLSRD